jgi:hypothetical protein
MTTKQIAAAIGTVLWAGRQEFLVLLALGLWVGAWWETSIAVALAGPAVVVVWFALPSRPPFIRKDK